MSAAFHRLEIAEIRRETPDAVAIAFKVPAGLREAYRFDPGQHLTLRMTVGGREIRRSYSICSGIEEGELCIAVKRVEDGCLSRLLNDSLSAGEGIDVMVPQGRFGLRPDPAAAGTYLMIAAGSGITPIISIIRSVLVGEASSRVILLYGNRTTQSIMFKQALEDLKDRFIDRFALFHALSRERQEHSLLNGRIDAGKIELVVRTIGPTERIDGAFLCGPGGLIEEARATLLRLGLPQRRIHVEYFTVEGTPASVRPRGATKSSSPAAVVKARLNGSEHQVPVVAGETIVEAGLRQGLEMPYSCRAGMCCTCRAKLVEGRVEMERNYSLEDWELAAGYVLTCQSRPLSPSVVVDYDQL